MDMDAIQHELIRLQLENDEAKDTHPAFCLH